MPSFRCFRYSVRTTLARGTGIAIIFILLLKANASLASTQTTGIWTGINITGSLLDSRKFKFVINPELRFIDQTDYFQRALVQAGVGYQYRPNVSFWLGGTLYSKNQITGSAQENHLWQQVIWQMVNNKSIMVSARTQLEERERVNESQWANYVREKLTLRLPDKIYNQYTPVIYDELFVAVNQPSWANQQRVEQNRFFTGIDIPTTQKTFLEVGYLNQTLFRKTENQMNNILYLTWNIKM